MDKSFAAAQLDPYAERITTVSPTYARELAVAEFGDRDWEEAIAYADFVRIRFPFSRYAVEAELLLARAEFELKNYVTAQDAFRQFLRLHPTHKQRAQRLGRVHGRGRRHM
ncbi:MAG: outer membrane protein assembly factor BamD, partial [Chloroflexaceae bacterium]|nr:outer membrane protein assembly factor BamD [Chloroflexaceae bacterium]